jgi:hypothetical protein
VSTKRWIGVVALTTVGIGLAAVVPATPASAYVTLPNDPLYGLQLTVTSDVIAGSTTGAAADGACAGIQHYSSDAHHGLVCSERQRGRLVSMDWVSMGPSGYQVDGAGPELLAEHLDRLIEILAETSPRIRGLLRPGLSETAIREQFASIDLEPCAEAVVWWSHHNGFAPGLVGALGAPWLCLEDAIRLYREEPRDDEIWPWPDEWVRFAGGGVDGLIVSNRADEQLPRVRYVSVWADGATAAPEDTQFQVMSMSTTTALRLRAIDDGLIRYLSEDDAWDWADPMPSKPDWLKRGLF